MTHSFLVEALFFSARGALPPGSIDCYGIGVNITPGKAQLPTSILEHRDCKLLWQQTHARFYFFRLPGRLTGDEDQLFNEVY